MPQLDEERKVNLSSDFIVIFNGTPFLLILMHQLFMHSQVHRSAYDCIISEVNLPREGIRLISSVPSGRFQSKTKFYSRSKTAWDLTA